METYYWNSDYTLVITACLVGLIALAGILGGIVAKWWYK